MKKLLLVLMIFCFVASAFAISEDDITFTAIKDTIRQNETATFNAHIFNNASNIKDIRIYSPDVEWNIGTITAKAYPQKESTVSLSIKPTKYIAPGTYGITFHFKDLSTEELVKKVILVNVVPPGQAFSNYVPSIVMEANMEKEIEPGTDVTMAVVMENQNVLVLDDITLKITSDIDVFNTEQAVSIKSLEKKAVEMTFSIDPLQKPGDYRISYSLIQGSLLIAEGSSVDVKVISTTPPYKESIDVNEEFLKTEKLITYTSQSNIDDLKTIKIRSGIFKRLFTDVSEETSVIKEDGKKYIAFDLELAPGESKTVSVVTNYRILLYAIIIILIALFLYTKYKSPVKITKSISNIGTKEGGISKLKILLSVKNVSKKKMGHIKIVDYVPDITKLSKEFVEGTLKPSRIMTHEKKGMILVWEMPELAQGEERLISYDLNAKLSILGNFKLPRAKVVYKRKHKETASYSNSVGVNI